MKHRLVFAPSAERDLNEILVYIAADKPGAASKFVRRLRDSCSLLAKQPMLGQECPELRLGVRRFSVQDYIIFYRITESTVEITRVIHGARDWLNMLS